MTGQCEAILQINPLVVVSYHMIATTFLALAGMDGNGYISSSETENNEMVRRDGMGWDRIRWEERRMREDM